MHSLIWWLMNRAIIVALASTSVLTVQRCSLQLVPYHFILFWALGGSVTNC